MNTSIAFNAETCLLNQQLQKLKKNFIGESRIMNLR